MAGKALRGEGVGGAGLGQEGVGGAGTGGGAVKKGAQRAHTTAKGTSAGIRLGEHLRAQPQKEQVQAMLRVEHL